MRAAGAGTGTGDLRRGRRIGAGPRYNVEGEGPPERRSRGGNQQAQLVGGPSRPMGWASRLVLQEAMGLKFLKQSRRHR
jgi:hypothetical protein